MVIKSVAIRNMPTYFVSDVHLHLDWPDHGQLFSRFVKQLNPHDQLIIGGDLHDYWFSARQRRRVQECAGLSAIKDFLDQGGSVSLIAGNHDLFMGDFYETHLNVNFSPEPLRIDCHGFVVHVLHGHLIGPVTLWKAALATKLFHGLFGYVPNLIANRLQSMRLGTNIQTHSGRYQLFISAYRDYVKKHADPEKKEIFVFGHVHEVVDEQVGSARMIVLGEWEQEVFSYLKIDDSGVQLVSEPSN